MQGLLTDPLDAKPDNLIATIHVDTNNQPKEVFIHSIDHDLSFAQSLVISHTGQKTGQQFAVVKNVLYFFPQMDEPISKEYRKKFLQLTPEVAVLNWLKALHDKNKEYLLLQSQGIFSQQEFSGNPQSQDSAKRKGLHLPIAFLPREVINLYNKLLKLNEYLSKHPNATHRELFAEIEPTLEAHYTGVQQQTGDNPLDCIHALYKESTTAQDNTEFNHKLKQTGSRILTEIVVRTAREYHFEKPRYQTTERTIEEFIAAIRYARFDKKEREELFTLIRTLPFSPLQVFLEANNLKIFSPILFEFLINQCHLDIHKDYPGIGPLLHHVVGCGQASTAAYLINRNVNINATKFSGHTAMHIAADKGDEDMINRLWGKRPAINQLDEEGRSPLDMALSTRKRVSSAEGDSLNLEERLKKDKAAKALIRLGANIVKDSNKARFLELKAQIEQDSSIGLSKTTSQSSDSASSGSEEALDSLPLKAGKIQQQQPISEALSAVTRARPSPPSHPSRLLPPGPPKGADRTSLNTPPQPQENLLHSLKYDEKTAEVIPATKVRPSPPPSSRPLPAQPKAAVRTLLNNPQAQQENLLHSFTVRHEELSFGKVLGRGGFGVVYQGIYRYNNVAIKQLHVTHPSSEALEEFKAEMAIMAKLRCPQIIQLYGIYLQPTYGIVMEYMSNASLYHVLHSDKPLAWTVRYTIIVDIARGLAFLHKEEILHRDLKSLNVLLDESMKAKLTDFGLAKIKNETSTLASMTGKVAGTLQYMAPELFKRKAIYTKKCDIYSVAMTFWEIASRNVPFGDAHGNQALVKEWVSEGQREEIPVDCHPKVATLIQSCWDKDSDKRPSAEEIVKTLLVGDPPASQPSYYDNLESGPLTYSPSP